MYIIIKQIKLRLIHYSHDKINNKDIPGLTNIVGQSICKFIKFINSFYSIPPPNKSLKFLLPEKMAKLSERMATENRAFLRGKNGQKKFVPWKFWPRKNRPR